MDKTIRIGKVSDGDIFCHIVYGDGKLSITGVIGPMRNGNAKGSCGQIENTIRHELSMGRIVYAPGWDYHLVYGFLTVWTEYHLNDMHAGCAHQQVMGWESLKLDDNKEIGWHVDSKANMAQWAKADEHPRGVLLRPCPVCGYQYGHGWNEAAIPVAAVEFLECIPKTDIVPAWV